jgi:hypothetical protein
MKTKLFLLATLLVATSACTPNGQIQVKKDTESSLKEICKQTGKKWLEEKQECEFMPEKKCTELKGTFSPCESDCRHQENAEICNKMCIPVCSFKPQDSAEAKCKKEGGTFTYDGNGIEICLKKAPDAGKTCTKSSDCSTGFCIAENDTAKQGKCYNETIFTGCSKVLNAGKVSDLCS